MAQAIGANCLKQVVKSFLPCTNCTCLSQDIGPITRMVPTNMIEKKVIINIILIDKVLVIVVIITIIAINQSTNTYS